MNEAVYNLPPQARAEGSRELPDHSCRVSVVIPVYKNAATLKELWDRLSSALRPLAENYEIIFVDDACPENSWKVLQELAASDPHVAALALKQNSGQQRAAYVGLVFSGGEQVVMMDADLQDPPEAIPLLLARLETGPAAVFAGRRGKYESSQRMLTSRLFRYLRHWVCRVPVDASMFVAMRREIVDALLAMEVSRPFLVEMIGCTGLPLASLPVVRSQRPSGHSAYTSWMRVRMGCARLLFSIRWRLGPKRHMAHRQEARTMVREYLGCRFPSGSPVSTSLAGIKS